jgi:hypothetical protein
MEMILFSVFRAFTVGSSIEHFGSIDEPNSQKHAPAGSATSSANSHIHKKFKDFSLL